jgi:predicted nucleic acid-binding protein
MSRIYWDTMLFVYWIEDDPRYTKIIRHLLLKMEKRRDQLCASAFAVGEALVGPHKAGSEEAATRMLEVFRSSFVEVVPFGLEAAQHYASIRASHSISPPDAIHLACAAQAGTDLFLTNDKNLIGKVIPGIQFIAGLDSNIL